MGDRTLARDLGWGHTCHAQGSHLKVLGGLYVVLRVKPNVSCIQDKLLNPCTISPIPNKGFYIKMIHRYI